MFFLLILSLTAAVLCGWTGYKNGQALNWYLCGINLIFAGFWLALLLAG